MKFLFFNRLLALILCVGMAFEVCMPYGYRDAISMEIDSETEHEENSEKEKEKQKEEIDHSFRTVTKSHFNVKKDRNQDENWITPFIDFQTPPPRLS